MRRAASGLLLAAVVLFAPAARGDDWNVTVEVRPKEPVLGEPFEVWLTVTAGMAGMPQVEVQDPAWGTGVAPRSASFQRYSWANDTFQYSQCWSLVADVSGEISIPPIRVILRRPDDGAAETKTTAEKIVTVAPAEAAEPHRLPAAGGVPGESRRRGGRTRFQWWVIAGLASAIALSALAAAAWLRRDETAVEEPPAELQGLEPSAPEGQAMLALRETAKLLDEGDAEAFYAALSGVLTTYVIRRYGLEAEMLTTTEARDCLAEHDGPAELQAAIVEALTAADRVRFARAAQSDEQAARLLARLEAALLTAGRDTA